MTVSGRRSPQAVHSAVMPHLMPRTPVRFESAPHVRGFSGGSASGGSTTGLGLRGSCQGFSSAGRRGASGCACSASDAPGDAAVEAPAAKPRSGHAGSGDASSLAQALTARRAMPPGGAAFVQPGGPRHGHATP